MGEGEGARLPEHHHEDHHDGEDGDGVAGHPHDEQIHWNLFEGSEGEVPAPLDPEVGVGLPGGLLPADGTGACRVARG